ncbi:MAG: Gfo/Idh/MocA family oxidoreductase [Chloroflexi bacterium]|nr:Gfo/Idh/MocA family oxidoreductase [Chloroflexota bacterium]
MEQVRIGVIGTGRMGQNHCRVFSNMRHAKFVGVCDVNGDLGKEIARKYEVSYFRDVDSLIENVDAVSICTPTPQHYELVMRCLDRNVHVMVEKPFTETLEQARALKEAAESKRKLVVQVGHIEKFNPTFIELRKVLEGMTILAMNFNRLSPFQGSNVDVDVVLDLMIHDIGLVVDLFEAEPISMDAYGLSVFSDTIDHGLAVLRYDPGLLVSLTASRVTEQKVRGINVTSKEAYIEADLLNKNISVHRRTLGDYVNHKNSGVKYRQESLIERIVVPAMEPLFLELQDFVNCVIENKTPQVTAADGYNALRFVLLLRDKILETMKVQ